MDKQELIDRLNGNYPEYTQKPRQRKVQREGGLQIACVRWFRLQYPAFASLLFHPKNEADGATSGKKIAINAASGVVAGVPDLILALPSYKMGKLPSEFETPQMYHGMGIELKFGKTNNQTSHQKSFQGYWETAGYKYALCRSLDDFIKTVKEYMLYADSSIYTAVCKHHATDADTEHNKRLLDKIRKNKK